MADSTCDRAPSVGACPFFDAAIRNRRPRRRDSCCRPARVLAPQEVPQSSRRLTLPDRDQTDHPAAQVDARPPVAVDG